nr:hypothetical protein [Paracoccus mutanolyticus]
MHQQLGLRPARVNPNGGAIALGHPVGATGAIITLKAMESCAERRTPGAGRRCASASARASRW